MKEVTVMILTKSSKYSSYCVAGIDYYTGKWVRLVTEDLSSHGAVKRGSLIDENGREFQILDVIKVPVISDVSDNIIQPENVLIDTSKYMHCMGHVTIKDILNIHPAEKTNYILGNQYPYITESRVAQGQLGHSLTLVEVQNLSIRHIVNPYGKPKTKADFTYQYKRYENISVTDYRYYSMEDKFFTKAYLIVSIGTAYDGRYYKFISAIYTESL